MKNPKAKTKVTKGQKINQNVVYKTEDQKRMKILDNIDKDKAYTPEEKERIKKEIKSYTIELMRSSLSQGVLIKQIRREIQEEKFKAMLEKVIQEFKKSKVEFLEDELEGKMDMEEFLFCSAFNHINSVYQNYNATNVPPSAYPKALYKAIIKLGAETQKAFNLPTFYFITEEVEHMYNYFSYLIKEVLHKNKISFSWDLPHKMYCPTINWDSPGFKVNLPDSKLD